MTATVVQLPIPSLARSQPRDTSAAAIQRDLFDSAVSIAAKPDRAQMRGALRAAPLVNRASNTDDAALAAAAAAPPADADLTQMWRDDPTRAFACWKASKTVGKRGFASHSMEQYRAMFGAFLRWMSENSFDIKTVTVAQLESFLSEGIGRPDAEGRRTPAAASTRQRYLQLLKSVFEQLRAAGLRQSNPAIELMEGTDARSFVKPPPRVLQPETIEKYKAWTLSRPMKTWVDVRNRALRLMFLATGAMVVEVRNLRARDLSFDPETGLCVVQIEGWGMTPVHSVPAANFATEAIRAWLGELERLQPSSDVLFPASSLTDEFEPTPVPPEACFSIVQEVMLGIGWKESLQGPQTLRNTFIAQQIRAGVPSHMIRHWCGLHTDDTISRVAQVVPIRDGQPLPA